MSDHDVSARLAIARVAASIVAVVVLLYAASHVTDALWFWGGTHCDTVFGDIIACTGILPVGVMFTVVAGVFVGSVSVEFGKACWRRLA